MSTGYILYTVYKVIGRSCTSKGKSRLNIYRGEFRTRSGEGYHKCNLCFKVRVEEQPRKKTELIIP